MADNNEIKVKSLQKALEILNLFTVKPVLGVTEISEYFGIYKSTVHNILSTLKAMEYLEQDEETGKYRLGIQVFTLSKALGDTYSITKIATPYLQELSNQTRERVYLAVPYRSEVLYLDSMYPADSVELMRSILGERAQMYCTGIGKAMLANMNERTIEEYLATHELKAFTENSITDKEEFRQELLRMRLMIWSMNLELNVLQCRYLTVTEMFMRQSASVDWHTILPVNTLRNGPFF